MRRSIAGSMILLRIRSQWGKSTHSRRLEAQSPVRHRGWPLSYCLGTLLCLILLPPLVYKAVVEKEKMLHTTTVFGDNLFPAPWHWHDNPLGPHAFSWGRSLEVKRCSIQSWILPALSTLSSMATGPANTSCPQFFRWIRSDLAPWFKTGITRSNVETAKEHAAFRVTIVNGKLYLETYYSCVQTRALFTVWGILLLLEKYKGLVPDVDLMFDCMDRPHIEKMESSAGYGSPPALFRYCSTKDHHDIPFPDWSFWGWSETELEPWDQQREKIVGASAVMEWKSKTAKAFWRGNPDVGSPLRMELLKCNNATGWSPSRAEIQNQNWANERAGGYQYSKLENQCKHRYKIYAEGFAWSVSFKYIMSCGSPTLALSPKFHDFFMRGLQSWIHYIPVRPSEICAKNLCSSIDSAVKWGEANPSKALEIGKAGQEFLRTQLNMNNVYDYMYHLISEYAKLQTFKPVVPNGAEEVTQNFILCLAQPPLRSLLQKSSASVEAGSTPCRMLQTTDDFVKDSDWHAREHATLDWSEKQCPNLDK